LIFYSILWYSSIVKRNWLILIAAILGISLVGLVVKSKLLSKTSPAAISISTTPKATIFIDGAQVGMTPYLNDKIQPGEHMVKLVPEATSDNLVSWEGKVNLTSGILTVINRTLGPSESASSGEIIWLEKISSKDKSSLAVVSTPDQAVIKIDGEPKGFAPVALENLNPGSYQIAVASPGYEERAVSAKTVAGYKLIVNVQLAKKIEGIEEATPSGEKVEISPTPTLKTSPTPKATPKATATPPEKPYVKIKETPTGWLRVRMEPSTSATEAAKVKPGEMFPYLNEEKNGWYKIEYEENKEGWVSGVYVELIE
jgi:hypothetical protein